MSTSPLNSVAITTRLITGLLILGFAGGVYVFLALTKPKPHAAESDRDLPRVMVVELHPVNVARGWSGYGTARAMDAADVPSRVTATVVEIPESAKPGQAVAQGELIARLDDTDSQNQLQISTHAIADVDAQLNQLEVEQRGWTDRIALLTQAADIARRDVKRLEDAQASEAAKMREVDAARTALIAAEQLLVNARETLDRVPARRAGLQAQRQGHEANLAIARMNVERCRIVSPIDGILQAVDVDQGESLLAGNRVARVVSLDRIEVPLFLPASARAHLAAGAAVALSATGSSHLTWNARIARISPEDDQATRTLTAYVEVDQSSLGADRLAPGQFVWGEVAASMPDRRWVLPRRSAMNDRVMLVEDGVIRSRAIEVDYHTRADVPELGLPDTQWIVLKNDLQPRSLVVVDGARSLTDGSRVIPIPAGQVAGAIPKNQNIVNIDDWTNVISDWPLPDPPRDTATPADAESTAGGVPQ